MTKVQKSIKEWKSRRKLKIMWNKTKKNWENLKEIEKNSIKYWTKSKKGDKNRKKVKKLKKTEKKGEKYRK